MSVAFEGNPGKSWNKAVWIEDPAAVMDAVNTFHSRCNINIANGCHTVHKQTWPRSAAHPHSLCHARSTEETVPAEANRWSP